jgi:MEMO1 family protein
MDTGVRAGTVRPPAVAGTFYPGEPDRLRGEVGGLLEGVPPSPALRPKALIAPHAGYSYSGRVAAAAFATLRSISERVRRVIVIGPAHYVRFRGIAVPSSEAFTTPLGRVPIDGEAIADLIERGLSVLSDAPHAPEHALEVELPFLQLCLDDFALVPLVVGDTSPTQVAAVLDRLWGEEETLIVVSSDLSHFHPYEVARRRDAATAEAIERGDWTTLGPGDACGFLPVAGLLIEAGRRGLNATRLALCNSGDTAGPRSEVVGYGAWAFPEPGRS